jgi:hypothetical protein
MFKTKSNREITYYYPLFFNTNVKSQEFKDITTLDDLFGKLLKCWDKSTAYPSCQKDYDNANDPTYGQCAITAMIVNDLFGGTIHKIKVDNGGTHYFNKINGEYVDLTSDQFDLYNIDIDYEPNEKIDITYCGKNADTLKRYKILKNRLMSK